MLLKIFKHDFKTNARSQLSVLLALIGATLIACINVFVIDAGDQSTNSGAITSVLGALGLVFIVIAIFAASTVANCLLYFRFYKSMVTDEGYLTLTLPVKPSTLIAGKLFSALIWSAISIVATAVSLLSILSCIGVAAADSLNDIVFIFDGFLDGFSELISANIGTISVWSLVNVVTWIAGFLQIFFAILFAGCIARKLKALCAVGLILGFNSAVGTVSFILKSVMSIVVSTNSPDVYDALFGGTYLMYEYLIDLVLYVILGVVFFLLSSFLVKKKVNLD